MPKQKFQKLVVRNRKAGIIQSVGLQIFLGGIIGYVGQKISLDVMNVFKL